MSLESIRKQLADQENAFPPVEQWDPPYCGEIDIIIKANGDWHYNGSAIERLRLVKLFASVIKYQDDEYFLVTPVEKIKIKVEQLPFVVTSWQWLEDIEPATMELTTNLGDRVLLNDEHPLVIDSNGQLSINIRRNLMASIHRNVFYQWAELADIVEHEKSQQLLIHSAGSSFCLGDVSTD